MDQAPLSFEYYEGQIYNIVGEKTVGIKTSKQSVWDKRHGIIQLTIFADGIPHVKSHVFVWGKGTCSIVVIETKKYVSRVGEQFNSTGYANSVNLIQLLDEKINQSIYFNCFIFILVWYEGVGFDSEVYCRGRRHGGTWIHEGHWRVGMGVRETEYVNEPWKGWRTLKPKYITNILWEERNYN